MAEQITREEAVQYLAMAQDMFDDSEKADDVHNAVKVLREAGAKVGSAPAFRCLVMGLEPEQSVRWGK